MDFTLFFKIASVIATALKECPVKKMAAIELQNAIDISSNLCHEVNPREGLNRMLGHLETAYYAYINSMGTWDFWDYKKVMWGQAEIQNKICLYIALIHYALGNQKNVTTWLNRMSVEGPWQISIRFGKDLQEIGLLNVEETNSDFYKILLKDDYNDFYKRVIIPSNERKHEIEVIDENMDDFLYYESHRL